MNLKYPYTEGEKRIFIEDNVFYVPYFFANHDSFSFPGWSSLFGNENPVSVEYCSGNGAWIADKAEASPHINWVAVEMNFERVRKIHRQRERRQLNNLLIVSGEALQVTQHFFPKNSLDSVFINFPDPWPKRRHAKNRIIQAPFISLLTQVLRPGGEFVFVTDDPDFSEVSLEVLLQEGGLAPIDPKPHYITELPNYGTSYFETLWRDKGKVIRYHRFRATENAHGQTITIPLEGGAPLPRG